MPLLLRAPAKLNLFLRVLGRRPDGYHELETVFHRIDLADDLVVARTGRPGEVELEIVNRARSGLPVVAGPDNLVVRAGRAFLGAAGARCGLRYHLTKRIPAGGGLGGGSSDAAAALRLAQAACGEPLDEPALAGLALELGADVPFFLSGAQTCLGRGVGEVLEPLDDPPPMHFVLLMPEFGTSTAAVFENYEPQLCMGRGANRIRSFEGHFRQEIALASQLRNDLEKAAEDAFPELRHLRGAAEAAGFPDLRMSGSGSTMFLTFDVRDDARNARTRLARAPIRGVRLRIARSGEAARAPGAVPWPGGAGGPHEH